jgi:cyanophycinase-like exopeptidase
MNLLDIFKQYLNSKKAIAALAAMLITIAQYAGIALDEPTALTLVGILMTYIIGQGGADIGKEAAKQQAES